MLRFLLSICFLPLLLMLGGCAKRADYATNDYYYAEDAPQVYAEEASGRSYRAERSRAPSAAPMQSMDMRSDDGYADMDDLEEVEESEQGQDNNEADDGRMVYYSGYLHLRVVRAEEAAQQVAELARAAGGYVEQLSPQRVVVRVPVDAFEEAFEAALGLGEVLDRNVSAQDVTEAFTDVGLRLQTLKSTHERLVELLAKAKDEQEKLTLLREIRRVTEEIDVVEGQLRTLSELASFSRLTVQVSPRGDFDDRVSRADAEGLGWIQQLNPFSRSLGADSKRIPLAVPEGMVVLDPRGRFVAESADGAVVWTSRIENAPRGSAAFWIDAVAERLGPEFETGDAQTLGGFVLVRMVEQGDDDGYRYMVGVREQGKWLHVVQVYYPSAEQEDRYGEAVLDAIRGGQS